MLDSPKQDPKTPLVLVTGFLGAGKTTLLRRLAKNRRPERKLAFVVNEFADLNVDARLLEAGDLPVYEVSGGSLFCECKVTGFIEALNGLDSLIKQTPEQPAGVVIETSGITDPEVMQKLLRETGFARRFYISRIFTLIAPPRFEALLKTFPNLESQIRNADVVIINKVDLATPEEIAAVRTKVREITAGAEIVEARYAETDAAVEPWLDPIDRPDRGRLSTADANPYASLTLTRKEPVDREQLEALLRKLGERLLRAKGWVTTPGGPFFLDYASGEFRWEPLSRELEQGVQLVVIVPEELEGNVLEEMKSLDLKQLVN